MTEGNLTEQIDRPKENPANHMGGLASSLKRWLTALIVLSIVAGVLISGIRSRVRAQATLRGVTQQMAVPSVSVVLPKRVAANQEIILPGNIQPFISSPIYARTDGYLKKWYFDIGAHVRAGQLLAVIETPEVDQQLAQARATVDTARANLELSRITMERYQGLLLKHAVAQQDVDNAVDSYNANKAIVEADQASLQRYAALVSFEKVYAPFITAHASEEEVRSLALRNGAVAYLAKPLSEEALLNAVQSALNGGRGGVGQ